MNPNKLGLNRRIIVPDGEGGSTRMYVSEAIIREVRATGMRPGLCAHAGRTNQWRVNYWIREGAKLAQRVERGELLDEGERVLARFVYDLENAKSEWIAEQVRLHSSIAGGGLTTAEVIEQVDPSQPDAQGRPTVVNRRVKTTRLLPDARAIEWGLERLARDEGFAPRTEVTGVDGGPIEIESREDRESRLIAELRAFKDGAAEQAKLDAERKSANGSNGG